AAAIYAAVARLLAARPVETQAVQARRAFATWWGVLAGLSLFGAVFDVISMLDGWSLPLMLAFTHILLLAILAAFGALLYYLVYLYTGWERAWQWIGAAYLAFWGFLVYLVASFQPDGLQPGPINPRLHYVHDPQGSAVASVLGLLFLLPLLAGALGYFTLFFKAREPTQRYRIAVVSLSLVLWFTFSLVGSVAGLNEGLGWIVLSRLVSLGAAACVYAAYRPPGWVRRRWGVGGIAAR
ncbi:MAG TPA: hypothetical protein VHI93_07260, partial [Candidatus Thermoplasmatota archaeon]|nr:hypothetical protein [Candidatus Thermoplasmatota archaeon]